MFTHKQDSKASEHMHNSLQIEDYLLNVTLGPIVNTTRLDLSAPEDLPIVSGIYVQQLQIMWLAMLYFCELLFVTAGTFLFVFLRQ